MDIIEIISESIFGNTLFFTENDLLFLKYRVIISYVISTCGEIGIHDGFR